jgi:hypothetical protein
MTAAGNLAGRARDAAPSSRRQRLTPAELDQLRADDAQRKRDCLVETLEDVREEIDAKISEAERHAQ